MNFCIINPNINEDIILVDSLFISQMMTSCSEIELKVYLYGLFLSKKPLSSDNTIDTMQQVLSYSQDEITHAFAELSKLSLVSIVSYEPLQIRYEKIKDFVVTRKFKTEKYADFNQQLDNLFPSQAQVNPNFYLAFYNFMEDTKLTPEVMIMIAHYCVLKKGERISNNYILTVAKNWLEEGVRTIEQVEQKIQQMDAITDSLIMIAKQLGKKSEINIEDRQLYLKWTSNWGFGFDSILLTAKTFKRKGSMERLDNKLDEVYKAGYISHTDVNAYWENKQKMIENAIHINKVLGLWYENLDYVVEKYIAPWIAKGFDFDSLSLVADYCFRSSIRTLEGMNNAINKFFKLGCTTTQSINEYLNSLVVVDNKIKQLIQLSASTRNVTNQDRELYKLWTVDWAMPESVVSYACELSAGKPYAFGFVNNLLSKWKSGNIMTVDQAKNFGTSTAQKTDKSSFNDNDRDFSKEELEGFFTNITDLEDMEI